MIVATFGNAMKNGKYCKHCSARLHFQTGHKRETYKDVRVYAPDASEVIAVNAKRTRAILCCDLNTVSVRVHLLLFMLYEELFIYSHDRLFIIYDLIN